MKATKKAQITIFVIIGLVLLLTVVLVLHFLYQFVYQQEMILENENEQVIEVKIKD